MPLRALIHFPVIVIRYTTGHLQAWKNIYGHSYLISPSSPHYLNTFQNPEPLLNIELKWLMRKAGYTVYILGVLIDLCTYIVQIESAKENKCKFCFSPVRMHMPELVIRIPTAGLMIFYWQTNNCRNAPTGGKKKIASYMDVQFRI